MKIIISITKLIVAVALLAVCSGERKRLVILSLTSAL